MDILRQHAQVDVRKNPTPAELLAMIGDYDALVVRSRTQVTRKSWKPAVNSKWWVAQVPVSTISM